MMMPDPIRSGRSLGILARLSGCAAPTDLFENLRGSFIIAVFVVPVPPLVRRSLGVALRRVLPLLLAPKGSDVQVVPSVSHLLVTAAVDEVCAEHAVAIAYERVSAVPLIYAEVFVEAVRHRVPRNELPAHSRFQTLDVLLGRTRSEHECSIAGVQMSGMSDLVRNHGAAD